MGAVGCALLRLWLTARYHTRNLLRPGQATVLIVVDEQLPGPPEKLRPDPTRDQLRAWDSHHEAGTTSFTLHPMCGVPPGCRSLILTTAVSGCRGHSDTGLATLVLRKKVLRHDYNGSDS